MKLKRTSSLLLCFAFCFFVLSTSVSATSSSGDDEINRVAISDCAGKNGSYHYDVDSGTETFIPPDSTLEDLGISDDIPQSSLQVNDPPLEEIDPELDKFIESYLASESRAGDNRFSVATPSGYERSTCLLGARFDDAGKVVHEGQYDPCSGVHSGTGWLINNNYLVTAGHMVYDWEHSNNGNDGWAKHVAIYVGASNGNYIHYSLSSAYDVGGDYKACTSTYEYDRFARFDDWAIIKLKTPVSTSVSKLTPKKTNDYSEMKNKTYTTQGYPCDLGNTNKAWNKYTMYKQTNCTIYAPHYPSTYILDIGASSNTFFSYGQSGSPLYSGGYAQGIGIGTKGGDTCFILINDWLYNHIYDNFM